MLEIVQCRVGFQAFGEARLLTARLWLDFDHTLRLGGKLIFNYCVVWYDFSFKSRN